MRSFRRPLCALSTALLAAAPWHSALADEAELQRQIQQLIERIRQLEDKVAQPPASAQAPAAATAAAAAPVAPADVATKGSFPGSIQVPGTRTSFRVGGMAVLDAVKDTGPGAGGTILIPQTIPFDGTAGATRKGQTGLTARQSRLFVRTQTATDLGTVGTYIEGDFYGAGGNENGSNSAALRLRHAYVEWGPWLAGQTAMNITDLPTLVETLDFSGGLGTVGVGRQAQLRYTARWGTGHELSTAIENPESDVFGTTTTTMGAGAGATSTQTLDKSPDLSMRYAYTAGWGRVSFGGMYRRLTFNNAGGAAVNGFVGESSTNAWLASAAGRIKTFGEDSVQYAIAGGNGVGRYILNTVGNVSAAINNGQLEAIHERGLSVGYRHYWTPSLRSNLIYSQIDYDYPRPAVPLTVASKINGVWLNLIWSPIPNATLGLEWNQTRLRNEAATSNQAKNNRFETSFKYAF